MSISLSFSNENEGGCMVGGYMHKNVFIYTTQNEIG